MQELSQSLVYYLFIAFILTHPRFNYANDDDDADDADDADDDGETKGRRTLVLY